MAASRRVSNLNADDLGFSGAVDVSHINLFDHLTPRKQELLFESKNSRMRTIINTVGRGTDSFIYGRRIPQPQ